MQKYCDTVVLVIYNYGMYKNVNLQQLQICTGVSGCGLKMSNDHGSSHPSGGLSAGFQPSFQTTLKVFA